ncbi:MAG: 1-deoxy-D-xylulose-5-phosphate synthase [Oscillospiraceae bacterium]|nr:1-deoxy-D-xylulose-5-phosphate synthase [Oscillospiraceae bacterium]
MTDNKLSEMNLPGDLKNLTIDECNSLCKDIRGILVKTVSKTGGHLASNLGVVELTLALHRVFNSPEDKIVWDVGHQAYTHKILTGRLDRFSTLRQENGLSGFPKPNESEHDSFVSGHSSTSVSVACGIAEAMKLENKNNHVIAVIGDGALTGGLAYEGLNNAGKSHTNLIVILNHNDMSISRNVGALAKYLSSIRNKEKYIDTKNAVDHVLKKTPVVGQPISKVLSASKTAIKGVVLKGNTMFEDLGFEYLGPVDGHNVEALEEVLRLAQSMHRPVFVHVNTTKGKGYAPAERNPGEYHGISKFDIATGNPEVSSSDSFSSEFGRELVNLAADNDKICAVTAAMKYGTGLQFFAEEYRNRFFDVGIAEQHAVTYCAGLASMGFVPVFAVYSSFLQRAYDQLFHDAALSEQHMVIGIDRAGFVGEDGETHQGLFDVSMLTSLPGITVFSPSGYAELKYDLNQAVNKYKGIVCLRYPRGKDTGAESDFTEFADYSFENRGSDTLAVSYGRVSENVRKAGELLENEYDIKCDVLKLNKIYPFDSEMIKKVSGYKNIFFFEEGMKNGGIAEHLMSAAVTEGFRGNFRITAVEGFVKQASVNSQMKKYGLDTDSVIETVRSAVSGEK